MAKCRSCGAEIRWVTMPGGKQMPVDVAPHPEGNIAIHSDGLRAAVLTVSELNDLGTLANERLYRSHFASCPNAASHRK